MSYLKNESFKVISLKSLFENYLRKNRRVERIVVLTLDDGFQNIFHKAFPILLKFGFSSTVFLITDYISGTAAWIKKDLAKVITNFSDFSLLDSGNISNLDINFSHFRSMYPFLSSLNNEEVKAELYKLNLVANFPLMSWEEVKEMSSYGIDFGAHSCSHPHLNELGLKEIREEVSKSKAVIGSKIGREIQFFCYPYGGKVNSCIKKVVEETGFHGACSTSPGVFYASSDPYCISRFYCGGLNNNSSVLKLYLSGLSHIYFSVQQATNKYFKGILNKKKL